MAKRPASPAPRPRAAALPPDAPRLSGLVPPAFYGVWRDLFAGGHSEYWLKGGRGSGKSTFAAVALVAGLLRDRDVSAVVFRKVQATLRESVYAQVLWVIERMGLGACFRASLSPLCIELAATGQKILFRGADDPAKSKSLKLRHGYFGFLWLEELTEFDGLADMQTIAASVLRGGGRAVTLCTYNPPVSARAWVNQATLAPAPGRLTHHSDYTLMPPDWLGKPFLRQAEALRLTNERMYRHMFLGAVTGSGAQVFENLVLRAVAPEERAACDRLYFGLDFGFGRDPDAAVCAHLDASRGRLVVLAERVRTGQPIEALAETLRALLSDCGCPGPRPVTCDSADPRMIAELRARGVCAVAARKGPDSVLHGVRYLQSLREIVIDPAACPTAAREFSLCEYRRDGDEVLPELPDRDNHTLDAVRYAIETVACGKTATLR